MADDTKPAPPIDPEPARAAEPAVETEHTEPARAAEPFVPPAAVDDSPEPHATRGRRHK